MDLAYSNLAQYYDRLMEADYPAWARYIRALWQMFGSEPKRILELGCGTGNVTEVLLGWGHIITAVDQSQPMLEEARRKLGRHSDRLQLINKDMRDLALTDQDFDLAICACDGFNYLLDRDSWTRTLRGIAGCVKPGGLLLFDLNSAWKLQELYGQNSYAELYEDFAYFWDNHWEPDTGQCRMELTFFVPEAEGLYRRRCEEHRQKLWLPEDVNGFLRDTGWVCRGYFGFPGFEPPQPESERWQFVASLLA